MNHKLAHKYLRFALELIEETAPLAVNYFENTVEVEEKEDGSPVTRADREIEGRIRHRIHTRFPTHGIIGEEYENIESGHELCWVIDPIDGTKSFIAGIPFFTTLIALQEEGNPVLSVISAPALTQSVWAAEGCGAQYNGSPCHVRTTHNLDSAWFITTDPGRLHRMYPQFAADIATRVSVYRTWADAYGYLLLARGKVDIVIDPKMEIWDLIPVIPIVREAGGCICDFHGNHTQLHGSAIACATPSLFSELSNLPGYSLRDPHNT